MAGDRLPKASVDAVRALVAEVRSMGRWIGMATHHANHFEYEVEEEGVRRKRFVRDSQAVPKRLRPPAQPGPSELPADPALLRGLPHCQRWLQLLSRVQERASAEVN